MHQALGNGHLEREQITCLTKLKCSEQLIVLTSFSGRWIKIKRFYNLGSSRFEIFRMESCGCCCCCVEKCYNEDAPDFLNEPTQNSAETWIRCFSVSCNPIFSLRFLILVHRELRSSPAHPALEQNHTFHLRFPTKLRQLAPAASYPSDTSLLNLHFVLLF